MDSVFFFHRVILGLSLDFFIWGLPFCFNELRMFARLFYRFFSNSLCLFSSSSSSSSSSSFFLNFFLVFFVVLRGAFVNRPVLFVFVFFSIPVRPLFISVGRWGWGWVGVGGGQGVELLQSICRCVSLWSIEPDNVYRVLGAVRAAATNTKPNPTQPNPIQPQKKKEEEERRTRNTTSCSERTAGVTVFISLWKKKSILAQKKR